VEEATMDQRDAGNAAERGAMDPARSDPSDSAFNIRGGGGASAAQRAQEMATAAPPGHTDESESAVLDKGLHRSLPELTDDELRRLSVLEPGTQLDQGGVYLDLNHLEAGPITAFGDQVAAPNNRFVSKKETDYELWNRLSGRDTDGDGVPDGAG
jgi:hypothetical protein